MSSDTESVPAVPQSFIQNSESRSQPFAEQPIDLKNSSKLGCHLSDSQCTCCFLGGIRTRNQGGPCLPLRFTLSEQPAEQSSEAVCLPGAKNNHKERGWGANEFSGPVHYQQTPCGMRKTEGRERVTPHRKGRRRGRLCGSSTRNHERQESVIHLPV